MMYVNTFSDVNLSFTEMNDIKKYVGERLKECRRSLSLTQTDVAKKLFMTQQQYSRFENGIFELNYAQIVFLCDLFDISTDYLFGRAQY